MKKSSVFMVSVVLVGVLVSVEHERPAAQDGKVAGFVDKSTSDCPQANSDLERHDLGCPLDGDGDIGATPID